MDHVLSTAVGALMTRDKRSKEQALSDLMDAIVSGPITLDKIVPPTVLLHEQVKMCNNDRLVHIDERYSSAKWQGAGLYGFVLRCKRDKEEVALKLVVTSVDSPFFAAYREQEIGNWLNEQWPDLTTTKPTVKLIDWWRVVVSFEELVKLLATGPDVDSIKEQSQTERPNVVLEWFGLEMEFIELDLFSWLKEIDTNEDQQQLQTIVAIVLQTIEDLALRGFSHFDLHSRNIRLRVLKEETTLTWSRGEENHSVKTKLMPALADFGRSHVNTIAGLESPVSIYSEEDILIGKVTKQNKLLFGFGQVNVGYDVMRFALDIIEEEKGRPVGKSILTAKLRDALVLMVSMQQVFINTVKGTVLIHVDLKRSVTNHFDALKGVFDSKSILTSALLKDAQKVPALYVPFAPKAYVVYVPPEGTPRIEGSILPSAIAKTLSLG